MAVGDVTTNINNPLAKKSAVFDGVDDYVEITSVSIIDFSSSGTFSISARAILSHDDTTNGRTIFVDTKSSSNRFAITFRNGEFRCGHYNGTIYDYAKSGSGNLNEWNNIITTWDGTTFKLYLNGNELTITNSPFISNDTLTYIGASSSTIVNKLWKGGISDIKIWNRALTTAEILLVSQNRPVLDGLTNRWKLDKDYTDSVGDNDGTNNGSYLSSVDDQVASDVSSARVTANDIIKVFPINNKIMNVNIEEA